jgi:Mn2+/Fe2+ NRAMP family transporter
MKKLAELALGIVTSIGGFLDAGSIATAAQAGAAFGNTLLWALLLGTICLIFLVEMSGRFAAVSGHTVAGAVRERFGYDFFVIPLSALVIVTYLVFTSEIGGTAFALQLATGISYRWWAIPVAALAWALLWRGTFGVIEKGVSLLGLVTVAFIVGALRHHPDWHAVIAGLAPGRPTHDATRYWFIAVSILGATVAPYLLYFYASGAVEDRWDESQLGMNRVVATFGMSFGALLSAAIIVLAALVFFPRGIRVERYEQVALILTGVFGRWGFTLVVLSLAIACFGAALEVALAVAYLVAQGFGWHWSEDAPPREAARFTLVYTAVAVLGPVPLVLGLDPLELTIFSMAITSAALPFAIGPFLVLMNDEDYVGEHGNGPIANAVVLVTMLLGFVLAVVTIPLVVLGG